MLLTQPVLANAITLDGCPDWVMPNADAAGYYRFALEPERRARLTTHFGELGSAEQLAYVGSLDAAYSAGTVTTEEYLAALPMIARGGSWEVVSGPFENVRWIRDQLASAAALRGKLEAYLQATYRPVLERYGLDEKPGEDIDAHLSREGLSGFLLGWRTIPSYASSSPLAPRRSSATAAPRRGNPMRSRPTSAAWRWWPTCSSTAPRRARSWYRASARPTTGCCAAS
ncbi:MAG: ERAP1-like C-terminal domain-containing protein [Deltaproteobacteria bacterium]|nr:ERAP1-like C-terminal domain-containing protein [Deltaproteobacteria bacterium]